MKILVNGLFICSLFALASCGGGGGGSTSSTAEGPTNPQEEQEAQADGVVTFAELKQTILTPKCIRCHASFATEAGLAPEVVPGNPEASQLFIMVDTGQMPRNGTPLDTQEIELVRTYILGVKLAPSMLSERE